MKMGRELTVALVSGFWGQNIGNAFFNIGGKWLLENTFSGAKIKFIQDAPGYRTFNNQAQGNPVNDWNLLKRIKCDYLVLQGPMLTVNFPNLWKETFRELKSQGTQIILLSAGLFRYNEEEVRVNKEFLKEVSPVIFSTRDLPTFESFKDCSEHVYCGIDSAFFAPKAYEPFELNTKPYIAINYDRFPEPNIKTSISSKNVESEEYDFQFLNRKWKLQFPRLLENFSSRGKVQSYFSSLLDFRRMPTHIDEFEVVRPEHRFNPHVTWKIYKNPNGVASDEPWSYFNLYANSQFTISDRVHACVATLAYGKPAILYKHTKRAYLFDRLGLGDIGKKAMQLESSVLKREQDGLILFLQNAWNSLKH